MGEPGGNGAMGPRGRWVIWWVYVVAWTVALVVPLQTGEGWHVEGLGGIDLKHIFSKSVHVSAYAVLTGLTGWLRAPMRYRLVLLFFVMVHAPVTELLQLHVANRTGNLEDVAFDHFGVALGLLLTWRWWSNP
jgi:hypothetical protein